MSDQVWDRSGTGLDTSSQLGTFLGESGRPGTLSRAVQLWTDKGGFADDGGYVITCLQQLIYIEPRFRPKLRGEFVNTPTRLTMGFFSVERQLSRGHCP